MNKLEYEFIEDRRKYLQKDLYTFDIIVIIIFVICGWGSTSLWWIFIIIMPLFALLDLAARIIHYLDLCSCLLEEQNEILKEKE